MPTARGRARSVRLLIALLLNLALGAEPILSLSRSRLMSSARLLSGNSYAGGERAPPPVHSSSDFERSYPRDTFGKEANDNGRVWKIYKDGVKQQDDGSFEAWKETLDVLLVFAGLFSAVLTAFIIEAHKLLEPDWEEISARSNYGLWAAAHNVSAPPPMNPDEFSPDWRALWSNWLWFISLMLSMIVALIAILAKQWINQYRWRVRAHVASNHAWVWRHRAFHKGLEDFHFTTMISTLPLMIHLSLFAFFAGLAVYLLPLYRPLGLVIGTGVGIVVVTYMGLCIIVPLLRGDCPMSTPIVDHIQHAGYRFARTVVWMCRCVARAWAWHLSSPTAWPTLSKARDLETFLEDRLLSSSHGPRLSADALSWMLQHFRDYDDITAALEAIGSLNVYRHYKTFSKDNLDRLRKMVVWRDQVLATRQSSPIERVYIMRAALFAQIVCKDHDPTLARLRVIDRSVTDSSHGASLIRAALLDTPEALKNSLVALADSDDVLATLEGIDRPGIALWSAQATERLLPKGARRTSVHDMSLHHLALLLWSIIQASLPDEHGQYVRAAPTSPLDQLALTPEIPYNVVLARRITAQAAVLLQYEHRSRLFRDADCDAWVLEALLVWSEAVKAAAPNSGAMTMLRHLYDKLLARYAVGTESIDDEQQLDLLRAVSYFATPSFADLVWSNDALIGALDLVLHLHRQFVSRSTWRDILNATSCLLARIDAMCRDHHQNVTPDMTTRVVDILCLLENRRSSRWIYSGDGTSGHELVFTGRLALLHCPKVGSSATTPPQDTESSPHLLPAPPALTVPSIWTSSCGIISTDRNQWLVQVATRLLDDFRLVDSPNAGVDAATFVRGLFLSERAIALMLEPDGRAVAAAAARISPSEWRNAADRLQQMAYLDQAAVNDLIAAVDAGRTPGPTPAPWSALIRVRRFRRILPVGPPTSMA